MVQVQQRALGAFEQEVVAAGEHLAQNIPGAVWHPFEGDDHFWWCGDSAPVVEAILNFAAR